MCGNWYLGNISEIWARKMPFPYRKPCRTAPCLVFYQVFAASGRSIDLFSRVIFFSIYDSTDILSRNVVVTRTFILCPIRGKLPRFLVALSQLSCRPD